MAGISLAVSAGNIGFSANSALYRSNIIASSTVGTPSIISSMLHVSREPQFISLASA